MNIEQLRQVGEWSQLWYGPSVASMGSRFGYSQQDIASAISWLKRVYEPTWVQANPGHPIVVSLFAPESVMNFLQVVDLGHAIATFPRVLEGRRAKRVLGDLLAVQGFYPTEYEIRVLSRVSKVVQSMDLGDTAARAEARVQNAGQTYDVEIFRKEWSIYAKDSFSCLARNGTPVNSDQLTLKELERLEAEIYERLDKVDTTIPMVFICSPPPPLMIWFTLNRTRDKTHIETVVSEIFRSVSERISDQFRVRLRKVAKLVIDMPDLVTHSHTSIPNHKDSPSEFICCKNPYFIL
jgi:hypothetical protein